MPPDHRPLLPSPSPKGFDRYGRKYTFLKSFWSSVLVQLPDGSQWFKIDTKADLDALMGSLLVKGQTEYQLHRSLQRNYAKIVEGMQWAEAVRDP